MEVNPVPVMLVNMVSSQKLTAPASPNIPIAVMAMPAASTRAGRNLHAHIYLSSLLVFFLFCLNFWIEAKNHLSAANPQKGEATDAMSHILMVSMPSSFGPTLNPFSKFRKTQGTAQ
jgi:hypothetical protein